MFCLCFKNQEVLISAAPIIQLHQVITMRENSAIISDCSGQDYTHTQFKDSQAQPIQISFIQRKLNAQFNPFPVISSH